MPAQYELASWIDKASFEDILKLMYQRFFGTSSTSGGGSAGSIVVTPQTYSGTGATSASSNNTSVQVGPNVTTARKIDIINTGSGGIWVNRGAAAAVGSSYYLAQYGVLAVPEPTTDQFFFISPSGAQTCAYVSRTAA